MDNDFLRQSMGNISLGATIGRDADSGQQVFQFNEDRFRHTVIIGRTGSGKSNHVQQLEREDIRNGAGCLIIAAHEEDALYPLSCVPENRLDDMVFADFGNRSYLPVMNPLDIDVTSPAAVAKAIDGTLELLRTDCNYEWAGPRFESFVRMGLGLMLQPDYPYERDLSRMETLFCDPDYLRDALDRCADDRIVEQWHQEARAHYGSDHEDAIQWFLAKLSRFVNDPVLHHVFASDRSTIDIADIVRNGKVLIVSIPEAVIGRTAARSISKWIMMQLRDAIKLRDATGASGEHKDYNVFAGGSDRPSSLAEPFFVYIDEFAKFADTGFEELLAESRKYNVAFTLSFQTISQMKVMDFWSGEKGHLDQVILGNVGSVVCYPLGGIDAMTMTMLFDADPDCVRHIERYRPVAMLCMDNQVCEPVELEVDHRPSPDNPTAPNRIVERLIATGVWTPVVKDAA